MNIKLLMIDDHPLILEGYKSTLAQNSFGIKLDITTIVSLKEGFKLTQNKDELQNFHVCFIDRKMPPYIAENLYSGEDLAILIKKANPQIKLVILTSHTEPILLYGIKQKLQPEGILVKSDLGFRELLDAFKLVVDGNNYYSQVVREGFETIKKYLDIFDETDRKIIFLLSQGLRTKNLPDALNLTLSCINTRKKLIKEHLNVEFGDDEAIVREAKNVGLL